MAAKNGASIGSQIDTLYALQQKRLAFQNKMEEKIEEMKKLERDIEDALINKYTKEEIDAMRGSKATATLSVVPLPQIDTENDGWTVLYAYIKKTGQFDLLEKRLARGAYRERYDAKIAVPGVKTFLKKSISLRKVGGK